MIRRAGAHRAIALLVIGDAVLGGVFVAALVRPAAVADDPARVVTATSAPAPVVAPQPYVGQDSAADRSGTVPTTTDPVTTTTSSPPTSLPATTRPASLAGPSSEEAGTTTTTAAPTTVTTTTDPAPPPPRPSTDVAG